MSKITNRPVAGPQDGGSVERRLARLLEAPFLARVVPHLPAEALHQLVRYRGLDACGELVASATPAQLNSLLDLDLWRQPQAGRDERFDVDRFGEWLEALVDMGSSMAARTVAGLDKEVVIAGLSRYVRVFDPGIFEPVSQSDDERSDRAEAMHEGDAIGVDEAASAESIEAGDDVPMDDWSGGSLECEVGGYVVRARRADAWDAIVTLLVTLDAEHGNDFHAVMQGCRRLSNSRSEIDGLDDLLMTPEQHLHDVTIERERRRSQQGYATSADARAFLQMARQPKHTRSAAAGTEASEAIKINPIAAAYFRATEEEASESSHESNRSSGSNEDAPRTTERTPDLLESSTPASRARSTDSIDAPVEDRAADAPESIIAVIELLTEAGMMPERPRALLDAADADPQAARLAGLRGFMERLRDTDEAAYLTRSRELAFLANTLLAGCSIQSRPFTPQEASDAAASICNLGLEYWPARWPRMSSQDQASPGADHDLVTAFEIGWSVLHQDVSLFVAQQLISTLDALHCTDRDIQRGLAALRRSLIKHHAAGTPWLARGAADVLAMLDMTAWTSVLGLLDECPVVPEALTAILEGRTTTVSPTAFDFISTPAQIGDIRIFMRKLPDVLSR